SYEEGWAHDADSAGRRGAHQDRRAHRVALGELLRNEATHGVAEHDGPGHVACRTKCVVHVLQHRDVADVRDGAARMVAAEIDGDAGIPVISEPALQCLELPCAAEQAVYEENRWPGGRGNIEAHRREVAGERSRCEHGSLRGGANGDSHPKT